MKIQKEEVVIEPGQSFKVFSPSLRNYFYWHYHAEFELILIEGLTGIRHVGRHISSFMGSDLVLIGSNIPHLNFDYGLMTEYQQIVVQIKDTILKDSISNIEEFANILQLIKKSVYGIAFHNDTKEIVIPKIKALQGESNFTKLLNLWEILEILSRSKDYTLLNDEDTSVKLYLNDKLRMGNIYDYIQHNYHQNTDINEIARKVSLSTPAFCRYFKQQTKMTFTDFVNQYRINLAKTMLLQDINVTEACYNVGFQSLSYFNKLFRKITGFGPLEFKRRFKK